LPLGLFVSGVLGYIIYTYGLNTGILIVALADYGIDDYGV